MIRLLIVATVLGIGCLEACTVPVFRYALDRWAPDRYRLEVAPKDVADPAVARFLRNFGANSPLNLDVKRSSGEPSRLFAPEGETPVWEGALNGETLAGLTDSKTGAELTRRILSGDAAVWILAESGNATADDQVAAAVEKRLRYLEQVAQLPAIDPNDPDSQVGPGPALAVRFSLLRVPPSQTILRRMLAGNDTDLTEAHDPWLAVVYGRGRVLGAWRAAEVGDEQIEQGCLFLLGACSCRVKSLNPGWDLLLPVDWDTELEAMGQAPLPGQETASSPAEPEAVKISGRSTTGASPQQVSPRTWALVVGILLAGGLIWQQSQGRRR